MDKIYNDAKDKNVAKVIVYGVMPGTDDESGSHLYPSIPLPYAYADSALTKKLTISELRDAFLKGCTGRLVDCSESSIKLLDYSLAPVMNTITAVTPSEEHLNKSLGELWFIAELGTDIKSMPFVSDIVGEWDGATYG